MRLYCLVIFPLHDSARIRELAHERQRLPEIVSVGPKEKPFELNDFVKPFVLTKFEALKVEKNTERLLHVNPKFGPPPKVLGRADLAKVSRNHIRVRG